MSVARKHSSLFCHLHGRRYAFSVAQNFVEIFRSENVSERRLRQETRRVVSVFDVGHRHRRVRHPVVDDGVDGDGDGVTSQHLPAGEKKGGELALGEAEQLWLLAEMTEQGILTEGEGFLQCTSYLN
jgi:hypothetical protein